MFIVKTNEYQTMASDICHRVAEQCHKILLKEMLTKGRKTAN